MGETGATSTDAGAFGFADSPEAAASRFSPRDRLLGLTLLVVLLGASIWFVFNGDPSQAEHPDVYGGSVVIRHTGGRDPVVVDMAARLATVKLKGLDQVVGAEKGFADLIASPEGHYLLNPTTGHLNLLGRENTIVNRSVEGGLRFFGSPGDDTTRYAVVASENGAYAMKVHGGDTEFVLIDRTAVRDATDDTPVPIGSITERGTARTDPESSRPEDERRRRPRALAHGSSLYVLVEQGASTRVLVLSPPEAPSGTTTTVADVPPALNEEWGITVSRESVLVSGPGIVAVADPVAGTLTTVSDGGGNVQDAPALRDASGPLLPVRQSGDGAWVAFRGAEDSWRIVGTPNPNPANPLVLPLAGVEIAPPVVSDGHAYSVDRTDGTTARVDLASGAAEVVDQGPFDFGEAPARFSDASIDARGDVVLVNPPESNSARIGNAPGEWEPIFKNDATEINPLDDPDAISEQKSSSTTTPDPAVTTTLPKSSTATIVLKPGCENTEQTPHKPFDLQTVGQPSSRTITVSWQYETQSVDDCEVSAWNIKTREQGTEDWTDHDLSSTTKVFEISGLKTDTVYEVVVQARLGNQSKDSDLFPAKTSDTDPPAAPVDVVATADAGLLKVTWAHGCTMPCDPPVTEYEVVLRSADPVGPSPITLPTVRATGALTASQVVTPELIGRRMVFSVVAKSRRTDAPEVVSNPVEAWTDPNWDLIQVNASAPEPDGAQQKVTIRVVTNSPFAGQAFGTTEPTFIFHLSTGASSPSSTSPEAEFRGLPNNETISYWVEIRHHGNEWSQPVGSREQLNTPYQPWARPQFEASLPLPAPLSNSGTITVRQTTPPDALGIQFTVDPVVQCGEAVAVATQPLGPELRFPTPPDALAQQGLCSVRLKLTEQTTPRVYDPALVAEPIDVDVLFPTPNPIQGGDGFALASTFTARWSAERGKIDLSGPNPPAGWGRWRWGTGCPADTLATTVDDTDGCVDQVNGTVALNGTYFGVTAPFTVQITGDETTVVPGAPTGVTATPGDGEATITWTAPVDNGGETITSYTVTAVPPPTVPPTPPFTCTWDLADGLPLTCDVLGLTNDTEYSVTVMATNSKGNGPASSPAVKVTPIAEPPPGADTNEPERAPSERAAIWDALIALPITLAGTTSLTHRRRKEPR